MLTGLRWEDMQSYMFLLLLEVSPAKSALLERVRYGNLTFIAIHTYTCYCDFVTTSIDAHGRTIGRPPHIVLNMT